MNGIYLLLRRHYKACLVIRALSARSRILCAVQVDLRLQRYVSATRKDYVVLVIQIYERLF